ncbi:MAG: hypothetical protein IPI77_06490 [Saprospiraceae bacterium]|nr:hypothetical protein [Saprospiraceae bacterium]
MGFSAYILETLNRYGRADIGALGTFILNYSPAEWKVSQQNFEPPKAQLEWQSPSASYSYSLIATVVASLHDISYSKAYEFVEATVNKLTHEDAPVHLGILGLLDKDNPEQKLRFSPNPDLEKSLQFAPLSVKPQYQGIITKNKFNWWLLIASAAFLSVVFILLNLLFRSPMQNSIAQNVVQPSNLPANTSLKQTNMAPEKVLDNYQIQKQDLDNQAYIIITGTFCTKVNADRMKSRIARLGLNTYEESLKEGCKRLGIKVEAGVKRDSMLMSVRSLIEPTAWILDQ